jgi:hypothetical protein
VVVVRTILVFECDEFGCAELGCFLYHDEFDFI